MTEEEEAATPHELPTLLRLLAARYFTRAARCRKLARELKAAADQYEYDYVKTFSVHGSGRRKSITLFMARMWACIRLYREHTDRLYEGARNTLPFREWLPRIYEVRDDHFGFLSEEMQRLIGSRDFTTFTELAIFLRDEGWSISDREAAQRIFSMWVCWKHDIGIKPTPDFYRLDVTKTYESRQKLTATCPELM